MKRRYIFWFLASLVGPGIFLIPRGPAAHAQIPASGKQRKVDFDREIRPLLSDHCFTCHGPDERTRQAGLRLDTRDGLFTVREGYRLIVPGDSSQSRLYQSISTKEDPLRMPPLASGRSLTAKQIELVRQWIDQGAEWEIHWAFVPPKRYPVPEVRDRSWPQNPVDNFILARLEREGLKPSPEADKLTLLRRVTLDLTGLPPTPAEVDAFLADRAPNAYEKKVDQLLQSRHYGERMTMEWLDLARYADTHGYHIDSQRDMWRWRDWVIDAFNRNLPFDQFTIEQLAGDLLPNPTLEQRIATGFNRNHMINFEGGAIPEEYHVEYNVDRVETVSTAWMALTMGCARCHDHKYDPIRQKDFYRFFAFFNNAPEKGLDGQRGNAGPVVEIPSGEQKRQLDEWKRKIGVVEAQLPEKEVAKLESEWEKTALSTLPEPPKEGLVAHYSFEGDLTDSSPSRPSGKTLRGAVTFGMGAVGKAGEFDGETHLSLGDTASFDRAAPFSLAVWFNAEDKGEIALLQKLDAADGRRGYEMLFDEASLMGIQRRGAHLLLNLIHRSPDDSLQVRTKQRLVHGTWHHLVVNYNGSGKASGLTLYIDGKPQDLEVIRDNLTGSIQNSSPLEIGNKTLGRPFKGLLDDLRAYNRQLTPAEIEQLAVHEPVRAILASASGACVGLTEPSEEDKRAEADPLVAQGLEDDKGYKARKQCQQERQKVRDYYLTWGAPERSRKLYAELTALKKQNEELENSIPTVMVMQEMGTPRETYVLGRGDYRNKLEKITPDVPSILSPLPKDAPRNRLTLAKWLVDPAHPLTARVAVNHFWQIFFGTGLVKTAENFGSQGEPPSHPELLDWLATEFIRTGWDVKATLRLMVTSAAYRQSSRVTPELLELDPENRLIARGPRFRLPAEIVRDNALFISGLLNPEIGGPSVFPYQPKGLWEEMAFGEGFSAQSYTPSHGKDLYRRSMYTFWKRTVPPAALFTFDAPDREKCTARRSRTNTPLQALVLMNDPTYVEAARALAQRTMAEAGEDPVNRVRYAFRLATGRDPAPKEVKALEDLARQELDHYRSDKDAALQLLRVGESPFDSKMNASELASWTTVANTILNLDEAITKE